MKEYSQNAQVVGIQFGVLSPEDVKAMSVVPIEHEESFEAGAIRRGGLLDLRMGSLDPRTKCQSCESSMATCTGHFGHVDFTGNPLYHVGFMDHVIAILKCICFHCSRLLIDKTSSDYHRISKIKSDKLRMKHLLAHCKNQATCSFPTKDGNDGCLKEQPSIAPADGVRIEIQFSRVFKEYADRAKFFLNPALALTILKRIDPSDYHVLGCNEHCKPYSLILSAILVPPPVVRPSNVSNAAARGEDDLTYKLSDIIRTRKNLKKKQAARASQSDILAHGSMLQLYLSSYHDNRSVGHQHILQRMGKQQKGLRQRIKGKEGRIRGSLMGKRDDFTARTVITPDPNISVNEVGIPLSIAMNLTYPEKVNRFNIYDLKERILRGPLKRDGANYVVLKDGQKLDLKKVDPSKITLDTGMQVERHITNGDIVLLNRQPSLHKYSIQAHTARIMLGSTFRLNLTCTSPYNADFDGDEMNLHVDRTEETRTEAKLIMGVQNNFVTPQSNRPVMGIVQDSLLSAYYLTLRDSFLTREQVMQLLAFAESWNGVIPAPCIVKPKTLWTGKQVFSTLLGSLNLERYSGFHPIEEDCSHDIDKITDQEALERLQTFGISETQPTIVNPKETLRFMETQRHVMTPSDTRVLIRDGELLSGILCKKTLGTAPGSLIHVIALDDGPESILRFVNDVQRITGEYMFMLGVSIGIDDMLVPENNDEVVSKIVETLENEMEAVRREGISHDEFELRVNKMLNDARTKASEDTMKSMSSYCSFKGMIWSGAKGSVVNPAQVKRIIGQNNVEGHRIPHSFEGRSLPHFCKGDYSPAANGFIENNYMKGLTPQETFHHATAGREGIIDTACKTSDIGYIQRRLCKAMEDLRIHYDGTVRNSLGDVVQFAYGEDGFDATFQEWQKISIIGLKQDVLEQRYKWPDELLSQHEILQREWNRLRKDRDANVRNTEMPLPVNIARILDNIPKGMAGQLMLPHEVALEVFQLQVELWTFMPSSAEKWDSPFATMVRTYLASKQLCTKIKVTQDSWKWIRDRICKFFRRSIISPGEAVGTLSGQSIGEPATQMTLRTFHYIGQSEKNVTLGVPRLKELVNATKKTKTPSVTIYLKPGIGKNKKVVEEIMKRIVYVSMKDLILSTSILYDPVGEPSVIAEDRNTVEMFTSLPDPGDAPTIVSDWLLRFHMNDTTMRKHRIRLVDIVAKIRDLFGANIDLVYNDEYSSPCIIRVRAVAEDNESNYDDILLRDIGNTITEDVHLNRINGIKKTYIQQDKKTKEYRIETDGSNLAEVFGIPEVDATRTICNDPHEVLSVLGVEAVRAVLIKELEAVLSFDNGYVNKRHPMMLADVMTHGGDLMSITRHGLNRRERYGPLSMSSFEETVEVLLGAARFHQKDDIKGVTENIILGKYAPIGTHTFDVLLNVDMLEKNKPVCDTYPVELSLAEDKPVFHLDLPQCVPSSGFVPSSPQHETTYHKLPTVTLPSENGSRGFVPSSPQHEITYEDVMLGRTQDTLTDIGNLFPDIAPGLPVLDYDNTFVPSSPSHNDQ